jgi:hypothetical protein
MKSQWYDTRMENLSHDNAISPTLQKDGNIGFTTHHEISTRSSLLRKEELHTKWTVLGRS